ncbi:MULTISPECIES: LLM class F420-dependent oxidoreductase [Rhodococcus]|jgi:probable F420-dependent oxidoreductase|uniref:LLM class F420-dependent oxidoreductase n=1 Tax=Rhodococcus TaxID=1827 RepID=UPI001C45E596|nr:LLM class F420-dependent oxidoreductase [Rhodococcus opacus]MBV6761765.1 LLM class F420-dependent oxidoreductase [Rhodococcus opacus]
MRYVLGLPTDQVDRPAEFLTADAVAEVAQAAENAGFDAVSVTDHPFPQDKWLSRGGHQALDPMVALSFAAARTTRVKLLTNVLVLPYRNPFLTARAVASLDVLSGGRVIFGTAVGYLRSEFAALGLGYDDRGARTDEALRLMKMAWTGTSVTVDEPPYSVVEHTMRPTPAQQPHPPIWFGGNSKRAMRRVIEFGQGWMPMPQPAEAAKLTRTPGLETIDDLAERIHYLRSGAEEAGRDRPDVCFVPFGMRMTDSPDLESFDHLGQQVDTYSAVGVDWLSVPFSGTGRDALLKSIEEFGARVIDR